MERIYNKEDAKKRMQRSVNFYQIRIEAWENVERVTKKDGSDFAILSKNFKNCEFLTEYGSNKIRVHFHTNENGYEHDDIYLDGDGYGRQAATTPEAVQDRITKILENYKTWLAKDQKGLETIEQQIDDITPELETLKTFLKAAENETNTHYTLKSYIKNFLGILND